METPFEPMTEQPDMNSTKETLLAKVDDEAKEFAASLPVNRFYCDKCLQPMVALSSLRLGRCLWCRPWGERDDAVNASNLMQHGEQSLEGKEA